MSDNPLWLRVVTATVAGVLLGAGPAAGGVVDVAAARWEPRGDSPASTTGAEGVVFPLPFDRDGADRFYWDVPAALDLSRHSLLMLEFSCDRPETIRSALLYFESGSGWYVAAVPIRRAGRQRCFLPTARFSTEGSPGQWKAVSRIRVSFWRQEAAPARFTMHSLAPADPAAVVVPGDASLPDAAERNFARTVGARIVQWLTAMGVPAVMQEEADFNPPEGCRVAILPYNRLLPDRVFNAVQTFVRKGGRLIVCYSSDPRLADLFGLRLGTYQRLTNGAQWTGFRFGKTERIPWPAEVAQFSQHIMPVEPAHADARIVALWHDETGAAPRMPAWAASDVGFWMTHVPNSDDGPNKQWLFAGMVATLDPRSWRWVAGPALEDAGRIDSFADFREAVDRMRAAAAGRPNEDAVRRAIDGAVAARGEAARAAAAAAWPEFSARIREVRGGLTEAYARLQSPRSGEKIGVWDHSGTGLYPGDWDRTCRELRQSGVTDLFVNLLWASKAHYPSDVVPVSFSARALGDQAAACLEAARRHGLRVHLWKVCWNLEGASSDMLREFRAAGMLQTAADGRSLAWLNPAVAGAAERELKAIVEAARRYPFDGIHLDYIRYPERGSCFGPASRRAFEAASGRAVRQWPADVAGSGARSDEYRRWRAAVITEFVRRCRVELANIRPGMQLSAAVFADGADCPASVGQDWPLWLREGLVDFVCPMNYDDNLRRFAARCAAHAALPGASGRIWQGIGASSGESQLYADQVIEQVLEARRYGAAGFVVFDLSPSVRDHVLPALRLGLTAPQ